MKLRYVYSCIIATFLLGGMLSQDSSAAEQRAVPTDNDAIYTTPTYDPRYQQYYQPQQPQPQQAQPNYYPQDNDQHYYPPQYYNQQQQYLQQQLEIQRLREEQRKLERRLREQEIRQQEKEEFPLYYYY